MWPEWQSDDGRIRLINADCLDVLPQLEAGSVDAVVTDPPYAEINRDYGRLTEPQWHALMDGVVGEVRRVLTPQGSAVFVLQPNSERVGRMRAWLWEFMAKWTREWNMVQDTYWWNWCALPTTGATHGGLMRGSVKPCVWLGPSDCHRNQDEILWSESDANQSMRVARRASGRKYETSRPSGYEVDDSRARSAAERRGGVTPFNVIPIGGSQNKGGHSAVTPERLAEWWVRYICPPGGTVLDPFIGSGTVGLAAYVRGCNVIGIEREPKYFATAVERLTELAKTTKEVAA